MTFYQELQLNQAGSKELLRKSETAQERRYHALVYLAKVAITMLFCFAFVSVFSILFGNENSVVGVVVLLCLMVFRNADFGLHTGQSTLLLALFFVDMAVFPHLAQQAAPLPALLLNVAALAFLVIFGCHNPFMFNQSTLVLGYLLLYGYDVSGDSYRMRLLAMAVGALLSCLVFYRNHKSRTYETGIKGVLQAFDLTSSRTNWQLCQIICVPMVLFLAELCKMPRAMWAGIAAMSAIVPLMADMQARVKNRIIGNVAGVLCFLVLYTLLPTSIYAYIGILGGIGVGFSNEIGGVKKMIEDSVPQEFDVDAKVNVGNEFKYDNDDKKPKPRGGGSAAGGVVVNQYIYANTTDYAKQQKEAARQFRMIARTV